MNKIKFKLEISTDAHKQLSRIAKTFINKGYECYLIGGGVRDLLLGHAVSDYDFATNAKPEEVTRLFKKVIPTGIKHGTVTVLQSGKQYEITTYRSDGEYIDGRRPVNVTFSSTLKEDVERRDFTINGLAYDVLNDEIIDYVSGIRDLKQKVIRTIGDPVKRFSEDGLRPFRACRFASKLLFNIEKETFEAIPKTLHISNSVSVERIRDEFMKLVEADKPSIGLEYMRESGLMKLFLPELLDCYGVKQNKYHVYDIYYHSLYSCDAIPEAERMIKLSALFHDIGKVITKSNGDDAESTFYNHEVVGARITRRIMKRLKFSNDEIEKVVNLVINHMFHYVNDWTDGAVRRFVRKVGLLNLEELFMVRLADRRGNGQRDGLPAPINELKRRIDKVIKDDSALTVRDLKIDGFTIMNEFQIKPGPIIGKILNNLLELVLDDPEANNRDFLLTKAREVYENLNNAGIGNL